jgi:3-deoxy-7-phosphoheptulonate synthase/chorismate mutase
MSERLQIRSAMIGMQPVGGEKGLIRISGPCMLEDEVQANLAAQAFDNTGDVVHRSSLYKPRTMPAESQEQILAGYYGLQERGIPIFADLARNRMMATEVLTVEDARKVIESVRRIAPEANLLLWLGSRNQNQVVQMGIAEIVASDPRVSLMIKNQPWEDRLHWLGIHEYVYRMGVPEDRILHVHRGFNYGKAGNEGFRNMPAHEIAMAVRSEIGSPVLYDPSHTRGRRELVVDHAEEVLRMRREINGVVHGYDGLVTEVHPWNRTPLTDAAQQIDSQQYSELLRRLL